MGDGLNLFDMVADGCVATQLNADREEGGAQIASVGVERAAGEEFVSYGDEFCCWFHIALLVVVGFKNCNI